MSKIYRTFRRFTGFKNDARNAFIAKIKEPRVQTQFLVAGVERFELPNDGVRVRSLTAWRYPKVFMPKRSAVYKQNLSASIFYYISLPFCKYFNAVSCKSSNFFLPSSKHRYNAVASYLASCAATAASPKIFPLALVTS